MQYMWYVVCAISYMVDYISYILYPIQYIPYPIFYILYPYSILQYILYGILYIIQQMVKYLLLLLVWCCSSKGMLRETTDFFSKQTSSVLQFRSFSGYEDIDWYFPVGTAAMYYSFWQAPRVPLSDPTTPVIIWLQGGPGGTSQFGCFNELGPLFINGTKGSYKVMETVWSWSMYGHLLCPDQPLNVGFSYNTKPGGVNNSLDAAKHFLNFLTNFYNNELGLRKNPLYIAGESFAGHYIPAIAELILKNSTFNLKGIMIGDGWVDPLYQNNNYDSFLSSVGVVSRQWRDTTAFMQNEAITRIIEGDYTHAANYTNFIIADDSVSQKYYNGMNVLNYKQYDDGNINPAYAGYLQDNKNQFGVPNSINFIADNQQMYYAFGADLEMSFKPQLQYILGKGIRTLIYNGQNDFIVNTAGVLTYLNTLNWAPLQEWKRQRKTIWKEVGGKNLGWYKNYRNLIFVLVRDAGHLLPSDQPRVAAQMIREFLTGSLW